ncbi:MAG: CBS domain-containing protein, partial [Candidatus Bipolaricaulota bacterium]|nr:CBS domain-containing protein [Candidatus Bipolaricaulota bacterium]
MFKKNRSNEVFAWQVMTPPVLIAYPEHDLKDAARKLCSNRRPAMPVVDKHNNLLGIISYFHIIDRIIRSLPFNVKVSAAMQAENLPVIGENDVLDLSNINEITCVCDKGVLKGVIYLESVAQIYNWKCQMLSEFDNLSK